MNFKPLSDYVLITPLEDSQSGGLIVADADKKILTGKVLAIGNGRWEPFGLIASSLRVGDTVWFATFSKNEIRLDGKLYYVVPEREILGYTRENSNPN